MTRPLIDYARWGIRLDIPVFDAHAHIGNLIGEDPPSLKEQVAEMDRLGIRAVAVSSVHALVGDIARGNDDVAAAAREFPGRIYGYCHVSANYPEFMLPELERCFKNDAFRGIKLYQVGPAFDDPAFDPVWAFAEERGCPVLAHTWGRNLTGLDRVAEKHPDVPCLAAHAGSGFGYGPYIDAAKRTPNFYLDLTYSREHTNMIERFVAELGAGRVVWGSDAPLFSMPQQLSKVLFARISDEDKRKILYDNVAGWFRL